MFQVLLSISSLLNDPSPDNSWLDNSEAQEVEHLFRTDKTRFEEKAREWTRKYAMWKKKKFYIVIYLKQNINILIK